MVQIRVSGLPDEVEETINNLDKAVDIVNRSRFCVNRNSALVSVYMDVNTKARRGPLTIDDPETR